MKLNLVNHKNRLIFLGSLIFYLSLILLILFKGEYLLLVNGISCFTEGFLGFGGSLVFLAITVHSLGWINSIFLDCILATINLVFVSFLNYKTFDKKGFYKKLGYSTLGFIIGIPLFFRSVAAGKINPIFIVRFDSSLL